MGRKKINTILWVLIIASTIIRGFLAAFLELGNDEVYYWTYALYPDLSHFDHPPMVGLMIQLFTLDLTFENEFILRLSAVIFGLVNTWLIFRIGEKLKNSLTGLYAAFLYNASIYCFIIAGIFILPDTPQLLFWLWSLYFLIDVINDHKISKSARTKFILAGITIGLGMLSKYTSVFLWIGTISFILIYNRIWLRKKELYLSILISFIIFLPVILWNIQNEFISFSFHSNRVNITESGLNFSNFIIELGGQILYNNPVNFILILIALFSLSRRNPFISSGSKRFILLVSVPVIIVFLVFSLFRSTLPHWPGPGYIGLLIIAASYFSEKYLKRQKVFPLPIQVSVYVLLLILVIGAGQIKYGWLYHSKQENPEKLGKNDVSLDMYGWKQLGSKFDSLYCRDLKNDVVDTNVVIISYRWFPAANLDYYVARPLNLKVLAIGDLENIHKYAWINEYRGGFKKGMDAYFITDSRQYKDPDDLYNQYFEEIIPHDTIKITRNNEVVKNVFVYYLVDLKKIPCRLL